MSKSRTATIALSLLALLHAPDAYGSGDDHHEEASTFTVEEFEVYGVGVEAAAAGIVDTGIELPGEVRPNADRLAHVAPSFPGIVREVKKTTGDSVRAGDVLALIESENLATYELKAAFDGTVLDKHITPGEAVTRGEPAYIIADLSEVWVNVNAYQKALSEIHTGQHVLISTADGTLEAEGDISYIAPVVDQATRTATARVVLPNPEGEWRPGLFVVATVGLPTEAPVVVPRSAIHTLDGQQVIFVVEGAQFVPRHVTTGAIGRKRVEITSGLSAGERFASAGSFLVKAELAKGSAEHAH